MRVGHRSAGFGREGWLYRSPTSPHTDHGQPPSTERPERSSMDDIYDLVVIGAGPAGEVAAELAASFGRKVVVVERSTPGGVVTTTGGAPTKALREAAVYLTGYRQEEVYGVRAAVPLEEVVPILRARVERVRDVLQGAVERRLAARGIAYLRGPPASAPTALFASPHPPGTRSTGWRRVRSCWRRGPARRTPRASRSRIPTSTTPTRSTRSTGSQRKSSLSAVERSGSSSQLCSPRLAFRRRWSAGRSACCQVSTAS